VPTPEPVPLDILYQDDDVMAINKPAGVVVHPTYRNISGTILNGILWHLRDRDVVRPGLLSRLDKDTSGVVLVALSPGAHAQMQRDAHAGRVAKQYLAVVVGSPQSTEGIIRFPLRRDPDDRRRVIVAADGAPSETRYRVLMAENGYAVVCCDLVTGRTHQIRVHLAACGWPLAGDRMYGAADSRIGRQALHAWRITAWHPVTRDPLTVEAPLPADMRLFCFETGLSNGLPPS
jgi:23S rRNA pseudouridine1911/1915/1917 synthase